jgi:hypothetical protein
MCIKARGTHVGRMAMPMAQINQATATMNASMARMGMDINKFTCPESLMPFMRQSAPDG